MKQGVCKDCNKKYLIKYGSRGIFCSLNCYHNHRIGKPGANIGVKRGDPWNKGKKNPHQSGINHWRYIQDRSLIAKKQVRNDTAYKDWRINVYSRDNYRCKISNTECFGRIEAHHILSWSEYPELRYEINNGITLCHTHHPTKREEEKRLSPYFKELVTVSNE